MSCHLDRVRTEFNTFPRMSNKSSESKNKYDCDQCEKTYTIEAGMKRHKEAKHRLKIDSPITEDALFPEDEEFNEAIEDQELYDMMEKFSQKATSDGSISSNEIKSLNIKLQRFRTIMKKKNKVQNETTIELSNIRKNQEELLLVFEYLLQESQQALSVYPIQY